MVDFTKARERQNAQAAMQAENKVISELERVSHIVSYHLGEIDDWEEDFIYSIKEFLSRRPGTYLSDKQAARLKEMEDKYCTSICHALNKGGVKHG